MPSENTTEADERWFRGVDEPETATCPECGGSGGVLGGYVTRDMAMDAGEPDMEGMPVPTPCPTCDGHGNIHLDP